MSCFGNLSKLRETATSKVDVAGLREYKYKNFSTKKNSGKGHLGLYLQQSYLQQVKERQ